MMPNTPPPPAPLKQKEVSKVLDYANHLLCSLGFTPLAESQIKSNNHVVLDTLFVVLHAYQVRSMPLKSKQNKHYHSELESRLQVLQNDHTSTSTNLSRVKAKLEQAEREMQETRTRLELTLKSLEDSNQQLVKTKDEAKALRAQMVSMKNQFSHDIRKREKEYEKLRASYQKVAYDNSSSKSGIFINGTLQLRGVNKKQQDDISQVVKDQTQQRLVEAMNENQKLKTALYDIYTRLSAQASKFDPDLGKKNFMLPFEMVEDAVTDIITEQLEELKLKQKEGLDSAKVNEMLKKIHKLEEQRDHLQEVVEEQNRLLEISVKKAKQQYDERVEQEKIEQSFQDRNEKIKRELEREAKRLEQLKEKLEDDRKKFTEAAIRLGQERQALEQEKADLEEEKKQVLFKQFPETPSWLKKQPAPSNIDITPNVAMKLFGSSLPSSIQKTPNVTKQDNSLEKFLVASENTPLNK